MRKLLFSLFVCFSVALQAQTIKLSGVVRDASTLEALPGATLIVKSTKTGSAADIDGKFTLALPVGQNIVICRFIGYNEAIQTFNVTKDQTFDFYLKPDATKLSEVEVTGEAPNANIIEPQMGVQKISMKQARLLPAFMGEVDIIKNIQLMPGVQSPAEGSSGFSVRGGDIDQNLILLDDVTVYNASHLMGFFSIFNSDYVKSAILYKGDLPAPYGGRLSSLLDIESINGNSEHLKGKGGIGTISSRLTLEGPVSEKFDFALSARKTYLGMFMKLSSDDFVRKSALGFYDVNGKVSFTPNANNRITISTYLGDDNMGTPFFGYLSGNKNVSLRWSSILSNDFRLVANTYFARFRYKFTMDESAQESFVWMSKMDDLGANVRFIKKTPVIGEITFGTSAIVHALSPASIEAGPQSSFKDYKLQTDRSVESALFFSASPEVGEHLKLKIGFRGVSFFSYGKSTIYDYDANYEMVNTTDYQAGDIIYSDFKFEPRLGLTWLFNDRTSLKASYSENNQFIQQARNSSTGTPIDTWFMSSKNVAPQHMSQVAVGLFQNLFDDKIKISVEGFYKDMDNSIDFKEHPNLLFNEYLDAEVRQGISYAKGAEFLLEYNDARWSGWLSYTYTKAERKINDIEVEGWYRSLFDRPVDISLVGTFKASSRVTLGASWLFTTGKPATLPVNRGRYGNMYFPVYSGRNEARLPDFHRLDLSVTILNRPKPNRKWQGEWSFSLINAYNRHNVWALNFKENEEDPSIMEAENIYLLPILPSVTYNFTF